MASPCFTDVMAAMAAVVNSKFPGVGHLLLRRVVFLFNLAYKRNDKHQLLATAKFDVVLQVVVTTLNALFIDKSSRKPLLLVSVAAMALGCLSAATSFYMKYLTWLLFDDHLMHQTYKIALVAIPALAVTGILLFIAGFSLGMGAVPWVIMSEFLWHVPPLCSGKCSLYSVCDQLGT
ncbi:sugar transporter ERD6-like protein 7 [Tanacetum coccineum]